jgi:hypothetical protein
VSFFDLPYLSIFLYFHGHNSCLKACVILTPVSTRSWHFRADLPLTRCWDFFCLSLCWGILDCILHIRIPHYKAPRHSLDGMWCWNFFCWTPDSVGVPSSYLPLVCSSKQFLFKLLLCSSYLCSLCATQWSLQSLVTGLLLLQFHSFWQVPYRHAEFRVNLGIQTP